MSINYIRKPTVKLLSYTNDPERVVAAAARTCYSNDDPVDIFNKLSDEDIKKAISNLPASHTSPFEHASFTFAISNVSRTLLAQITRHRIATFSVKSQRYVNTIKDFRPYLPKEILYDPDAMRIYNAAIDKVIVAYNDIQDELVIKYFIDQSKSESTDLMIRFFGQTKSESKALMADQLINAYAFLVKDTTVMPVFNQAFIESVIGLLKKHHSDYLEYKKENKDTSSIWNDDCEALWKIYVEFRRKAGENARYILPNACNTSMVMTMNAGSLMHFFRLRCCNRAQEEIRELAWMMREEVMKVAPAIFDGRSGPACLVDGKCSEGKMSCGVPYTKENIPHNIDTWLTSNVESGSNSDSHAMTDRDTIKWWVRSPNPKWGCDTVTDGFVLDAIAGLADIAKDQTDKDIEKFLNNPKKYKENNDGNS